MTMVDHGGGVRKDDNINRKLGIWRRWIGRSCQRWRLEERPVRRWWHCGSVDGELVMGGDDGREEGGVDGWRQWQRCWKARKMEMVYGNGPINRAASPWWIE